MSGKVIDLDPTQRLSKEALNMIKGLVEKLEYKDLQALTVIFVDKDGKPSINSYGLDFYSIGLVQALLNTIGQQLLEDDFERQI